MDVDVDGLGRQVEEHDRDRMTAGADEGSVTLLDGVTEGAILDPAAVDEEAQAAAGGPLFLGRPQQALEPS